ncbi:MAG TPA: FmdB family zinc ribbon protein [Terracidiphilus sp.]|nr:FmdB family zinc ribbon protein [Terracidiphilus sp.]
MPLYEYRCTKCSHRFDKIQKFNDAPETVCPKCGGELERPLTAPALQFKGAGWYVNDYASKPAASGKADKISAEAAPAGDTKSGESKPAESKPATTESKASPASESSSKAPSNTSTS